MPRGKTGGAGLVLDSFEVTRPSDFDGVFKEVAAKTSGVAVLSGPLIFTHRDRVVAAAARYKVPAIYYDAEYADSGGLVSYGPTLVGLHRSAAVYVDKIFKSRPSLFPECAPRSAASRQAKRSLECLRNTPLRFEPRGHSEA